MLFGAVFHLLLIEFNDEFRLLIQTCYAQF